MHFPQELPIEDVKVVISYLRGSGVSRKEAIDSGLWVLGCAAQYLPDSGPMPMMASAEMTDDSMAEQLESAVAVSKVPFGEDPVKAFPWAMVVSIIVKLIADRWFK